MDACPRILIVDDEAGPRESLKMLLKGDYEVTATSRGSEALRLLGDGDYSVVLLDLTMPEDLSGTESLRAIRAANIDVEALVITGQGTLDTAVECLRLGARDYIAKPFRGANVLAAVRHAVASRTARRRAMQVREHFLGNLSHEFRTPLNAIVGYSEILSDEAGDRLTVEHRDALGRIQRSSERLLSYLEGLFFLAEIDAGDLPIQPRAIEVAPWLDRLVQPMRREAALAGSVIEVSCPAGLAIHADADILGRLVGVLLYRATVGPAGEPVVVTAGKDDRGGLVLGIEHALAGAAPISLPALPAAIGGDGPAVERAEIADEVIERAARLLDAAIETGTDGGRGFTRVRLAPASTPVPRATAQAPAALGC